MYGKIGALVGLSSGTKAIQSGDEELTKAERMEKAKQKHWIKTIEVEPDKKNSKPQGRERKATTKDAAGKKRSTKGRAP